MVGRNLALYASDELRQLALSTVAIESVRRWKIAKERSSRKIDGIIALAMACVSAMAHRGEIGSRAARGFNASAHVAKEAIWPYRDSIFIGQTLQVPLTVVAQGDLGGITVLTAFANPGMSLSRHLTEVVRPWLIANCHFGH